MKFNGPAPEVLNGRLAMLGFFFGALEETKTGHTIIQQAIDSPVKVLAVAAVIGYATITPILKGAKSEAFGEHHQTLQHLQVFNFVFW